MNSADIRSAYIDFFAQRGHRVVPSSSLVPGNDPTLLFTNAGMVQFKDALLGLEDLGYTRAVSAQRCVRAGGKHNDLENVGFTARHHTLFEMLGNFSFGDYFKRETITWAWEFVTTVLKLPVDRIWVTVHHSDAEAREIWENEIGIATERVIDLDEDNFWSMGDTGPCGPSTEIFYDHGPDVAGGPPGSPDEDGDRYIEFWNLVFPQFDRQPDGELKPLPRPGVDTGMGLERVAAIVQHVHSNYEIDTFKQLLSAAGSLVGISDPRAALAEGSLRVIVDHIRSCAFLIADGVLPGPDERNYVLRRIIRRALRHGYKLGLREPFFGTLVDPLVAEMGDAYPILRDKRDLIVEVLTQEEQRFSVTLGQGIGLLEASMAEVEERGEQRLAGDVVFKLYDTYGFPVDLTADIARERGLTVDEAGFGAEMEAQRARGRAASAKFAANVGQRVRVAGEVEFLGYSELQADAQLLDLFEIDGENVVSVDRLVAGQAGAVVLDRTPFYAESGGQIGDRGTIRVGEAEFLVEDTQKSGGQSLHVGRVVNGSLTANGSAQASVEASRRSAIVSNHSGTHLLHAALRRVLGDHVQQKGSLVAADRLRFDFSHDAPLTRDEIAQIEAMVNAEIFAAAPVGVEELPFDEAVERGATALFGEKYGDRVRVLTMGGDFSVELCGGTHVSNTAEVGLLKVISESGTAAGVRRIEAVTGAAAFERVQQAEARLNSIAQVLKSSPADVPERVRALIDDNKQLNRELEQLRAKAASAAGGSLLDGAQAIDDAELLTAQLEGDPKSMMSTFDSLRQKSPELVLVLGCVAGGKANLVAGVPKSLHDRVTASELVAFVAEQVGGKGGGRADMARAGGGAQPDALPEALASVADWLSAKLQAS